MSYMRETSIGLAVALAATPALAQTADPAGSGPILSALQWIEGTLMGNVATTAAVIAVVLGAFIIFGAAAIVEGMRSVVAR